MWKPHHDTILIFFNHAVYTAAHYSEGDKSKVVAGCVVHEEKLCIIGNNHYMPALLSLSM